MCWHLALKISFFRYANFKSLMADENFEQPEIGNLHDTENMDDMNNVQDNDNVNGKDNVQGTEYVDDADHLQNADHVHDADNVHDHVPDTDDVHNMDNIHDSDAILGVNSAPEETHPSEEVKITPTDTGPGKEKRWPGWPGENVFRMLVLAQKVGGIIGRRGEYIKKTCEETKARIKVLDGPSGTTERAVLAHIRKHFNESGIHTRRTKIQTAVISMSITSAEKF
ncbi:hypothetical protein K7X08_016410 [Anisodus acutangulus]|uniref:K Homology domain-containing protein n=1 Tax=Anisodus acutangulus TaxID=402998 RepID=A0A9Q1LGR5_9SOLA|nr:hypothetical protein K7X08_016410 [Anisodus acutangulus]